MMRNLNHYPVGKKTYEEFKIVVNVMSIKPRVGLGVRQIAIHLNALGRLPIVGRNEKELLQQ